MADRNSVVDPAVDELRRKARRRLVGAVVLALAAAVILPMLLEREPRPLGEDVAVRIPPVDNGKFVNRLSGDSGKESPAPATGAAPAASTPMAKSTDVTANTAANAESRPTAGTTATSSAVPSDNASANSTVAKAEPTTAPATASSAATKTDTVDAKSDAKASSTKPKIVENAYVVQLAAFSDDKGANALVSKLKRNGYPAYTEAVQTSHGTLYRVRVGGYSTREAAGDARNKLKGDGYSGIVAAAH